MQSPKAEVDIEYLSTHYKSIQFKASEMNLWNREIQGKTVGIRIQSMLPQITLTSRIVEILATVARQRRVGVCTAFKYSPTHFLSLSTHDFQWADPNSLPKADYIVYIKPTTVPRIVDHLFHEDKLIDNFLNSLEKIVSRQQKIEILDLCRTLVMVSKDKISQKLLIRCEILFPYINLLFTPVSPMKLISSSFSKKLIQEVSTEFSNGFLTMDQNARVVPLEREDKMVIMYPIIGIWVKGVPQNNTLNKSVNLVHPLVFAACAQFILLQTLKEKVSPNPQSCTFLLLDFSTRPKFYEVSTLKPPTWRTTSHSKELSLETENFPSLLIQFLRQDTRSTLRKAVGDSISYSSKSSCNSRSGTPPSAKPPVHRMNPTYSSSTELLRPKSYDNIIEEQTKLIEKLQAQVSKLQTQVLSPKTGGNISAGSVKRLENNHETLSKMQRKINFADDDEMTDEMVQGKKTVYVSAMLNKPGIEKPMKIHYRSSSESSEEDRIKDLQTKYLSTN